MVQIYWEISRAAFVLAGIGLLLTIFLWFKFGIRKIIGELSGRTARKSVEKMREKREKPIVFSYHFEETAMPEPETEKWEQRPVSPEQQEAEVFETVQRMVLIHTDEEV